jgi:dTDP-4-amino-4,6-dideoxygalactose transaminase
MKILFNKPYMTGKEIEYIKQAHLNRQLAGDGPFTRNCHAWFEKNLPCNKALLTHSCTAALEIAAILADIQPGDEVIMPSYTFVSTANAFVLRGAVPVFVDIRPDTLNIDETRIEAAISEKTKAIVPVHYAGVGCEMDIIMDIANRHNLLVIEDAAQGMGSYYKGKHVGTIGHLGAFSFHETKNIISGEGGALIINDERFAERAEIIREKGTNRSKFFRGQVDKYTWVDIGSSFLPGELIAAFLSAQLEESDFILKKRKSIWSRYHAGLKPCEEKNYFRRPVPGIEINNAHMYYIILDSMSKRDSLIDFLKKNNISSVFHYIPLHSSPVGKVIGRMGSSMDVTDHVSQCLLRLPLYVEITTEEIEQVVKTIGEWASKFCT